MRISSTAEYVAWRLSPVGRRAGPGPEAVAAVAQALPRVLLRADAAEEEAEASSSREMAGRSALLVVGRIAPPLGPARAAVAVGRGGWKAQAAAAVALLLLLLPWGKGRLQQAQVGGAVSPPPRPILPKREWPTWTRENLESARRMACSTLS